MTTSSLIIRLEAPHVSYKILLFLQRSEIEARDRLIMQPVMTAPAENLETSVIYLHKNIGLRFLLVPAPKQSVAFRGTTSTFHVCVRDSTGSSSSLVYDAVAFFWISPTATHDLDAVSRGYGCQIWLMKKEVSDENVYGFRLIYVFRGKRACGCLGSKARHPCKVRHHSTSINGKLHTSSQTSTQPEPHN
jgi:hypothetical protein